MIFQDHNGVSTPIYLQTCLWKLVNMAVNYDFIFKYYLYYQQRKQGIP